MDTPVVLTQFKTFAFLTSVLALLGCGEQALNQSASEIQSLDGSANTLRLITYEEYFAESVLTKFTQKTGIAVDYIHCENRDYRLRKP